MKLDNQKLVRITAKNFLKAFFLNTNSQNSAQNSDDEVKIFDYVESNNFEGISSTLL